MPRNWYELGRLAIRMSTWVKPTISKLEIKFQILACNGGCQAGYVTADGRTIMLPRN
jgi:hypothetical protein